MPIRINPAATVIATLSNDLIIILLILLSCLVTRVTGKATLYVWTGCRLIVGRSAVELQFLVAQFQITTAVVADNEDKFLPVQESDAGHAFRVEVVAEAHGCDLPRRIARVAVPDPEAEVAATAFPDIPDEEEKQL